MMKKSTPVLALPYSSSCRKILFLRFFCVIYSTIYAVSSATPSPNTGSGSNGMLLRVRMVDGSMERILIPKGAETTLSLQEALSDLLADSEGDENDQEDPMIQIGSTTVQDDSQTIESLGLKQGSLISIVKKSATQQQSGKSKQKQGPTSSSKKEASDRWDPFPDLAKDLESAVRKTKTRRSAQRGMSYGDLANIQSSLHTVEPQPEGPLKRVYMCANSAERFQTSCHKKANNEFECRVGLLLGTVQRERVELKRPKARTSLSSQTEMSQYCDVVKVHALWEQPTQRPTQALYDAKALVDDYNNKDDAEMQRVFRIADLLGLRPVGWIFAYNDKRHKEEDSLPVYGPDAKTGSLLQVANMKKLGRIDGSRFVTLSMDATTGATEAFQLSDVCVQMVAEDLWDMDLIPPTNKKASHRFVATKNPVIVDGSETRELDSVLCLVNTAMLSHVGSFAGTSSNSIKKNGGIANKVKKSILSSLDNNDDGKLLETLCDFNLLLALDRTLSSADTEQICALVKKYSRGQKRGTELDERQKLLLRSILDH